MKVKLTFLALFLMGVSVYAQKLDVVVLKNSGPVDQCINMVILGDGYTSSEQNKFIQDAQNVSDYFFQQAPYSYYKNFFNVAAIKVISQESGVKHPHNSNDNACGNLPASNPNNYLGTTFDGGLNGGSYHRLVVVTEYSKVASVLTDNFPDYDLVIILANSSAYGGSGGTFAIATTHTLSAEVAVHEIGHSFAGLLDEYWAGDHYYTDEQRAPNVTMVSDPNTVKWKNWVGYNNVGVYKMGTSGKASTWYKPHNSCKMEYLNYPFCNVCSQATIEKIHTSISAANGIVLDYSPTEKNIDLNSDWVFSLNRLLRPEPNTLQITWKLDGNNFAANVETVTIHPNQISQNSVLSVIVTDTTKLLRVDNHSSLSGHSQTISWNINRLPSTALKTLPASDITVYSNKQSIFVTSTPENPIRRIEIYNTLGLLLYVNDQVNAFHYTVSGNISIPEICIVRVVTAQGIKNVKIIKQ